MIEIFDDIRKIYVFKPPCPGLADYIEFFSESSAEETVKHITGASFTVKMFASWTPTFWINLGSPYQLVIGRETYRINTDDDVLILRDRITERRNLPSDHIFTVKFFPGGLETLFGISQAGLTNQIIDLKTVMPGKLIQSVKCAASFEQRVDLLQQFFLLKSETKNRNDHYLKFVRDTIETFGHSNLKFNNNEIATRLFTTSKTINRYFHSVVGTSPKHYLSAVRTRATLTAYVADRKNFIPGEFGYYDMSHFYKDVVKFTGQKLSGYSI